MVESTRLPGLAALLFLVIPAVVPAATPLLQRGAVESEIRLNTGRLNGESREFVYDAYGSIFGVPGYKLSELDWQLNDVFMAGIGVSIRPVSRLRFNLDYWRNAGDGNGTMDDYDWLYFGLDWSHWSHHDNTTVTTADSLDINGEFTLYEAPRDSTSITGLLGYRQDRLAWRALGGYGIYSDVANNGYRDLLVTFPNAPVISYEQKFNMPYIGLALRSATHSRTMQIVLSASYRYSALVHGEDVDIHHLRALRFEESGDNGRWHAADVRLEFIFRNNLSFNLGYSAQRYAEIKASTTVTDLTNGAKTFYPGPAAGLDHRSNMLSLGLAIKF